MRSRRYRKRGGACEIGKDCPENSMLSTATGVAKGVMDSTVSKFQEVTNKGVSGITENLKNVAQGAQQSTDGFTASAMNTAKDAKKSIIGNLFGNTGGKRKTKRRRAKRRTRR